MTCLPSFYKHTQWLFLRLYQRGLAYQARATVNWDPVDKTVVANEQVDSTGRSWRSGAIVEKKQLKQWFLRITSYRDSLLKDLDVLSSQKQWPEHVVMQQRNWLGRSIGAHIKFKVLGGDPKLDAIEVYTTRPDTLFGVKYIALSTSHPLVIKMCQHLPDLQKFLSRITTSPTTSKEGYLLPNLVAASPLSQTMSTGTYDQHVPIYVAPYVMSHYGKGAVMGVPAHDPTDLVFWREQGPSTKVAFVVDSNCGIAQASLDIDAKMVESSDPTPGILNSRCGKYAGMSSEKAGRQIVQDLMDQGDYACFAENWRLHDWLISRQRYWGTPIPIIHCSDCGVVPVPEDHLPVELPHLEKSLDGQRTHPLCSTSLIMTECPKCGRPAHRETDTMDTFVDSSWYYVRFLDAHNRDEMVAPDLATDLLPVDVYVGGVEHAILHLLYARFIYKFLVDEGIVPKHHPAEPFRRLISQGMVHGKTFSDPITKRFLQPREIEGLNSSNARIKSSGLPPMVTLEKMSKSKHNGVDPSSCIAKYGADATRAHILFAGPVNEILEWDDEKIVGVQRWLSRVTRVVDICCETAPACTRSTNGVLASLLAAEYSPIGAEENTDLLESQCGDTNDLEMILSVTHVINSVNSIFSENVYSLNTAVSDLIKLTNAILSPLSTVNWEITAWSTIVLLRLLAPITPSTAQQCWQRLENISPIQAEFNSTWPNVGDSIFSAPFPQPPFIPSAIESLLRRKPTFQCAVQINGKFKFSVTLPAVESLAHVKQSSGGAMSETQTSHEEHPEQQYLLDRLLQTKEGKTWFLLKNDWDKRKRVVVVKKRDGSRLVNVVFPTRPQ